MKPNITKQEMRHMPTTWNRSPEEFHKIYIANTDAFYRVGSFALADELFADDIAENVLD